MELLRLHEIIYNGECQTVDFKVSITSTAKIARTIVAFANTRGGKIIVGVSDNKQIFGIDPDEEMYVLNDAAQNFCEPPIELIFDTVEEDGMTVLIAEVEESPLKPHAVVEIGHEPQIYIRVNDKTVHASKAVINSFEHIQRPEIVKFDSNELALIAYLKKNERITVKKYAKLVNISDRRAFKIMFDLVKVGFLNLHNDQKEEYFTLRNTDI